MEIPSNKITRVTLVTTFLLTSNVLLADTPGNAASNPSSEAFQLCLDKLSTQAHIHGLSKAALHSYTAELEPLPKVLVFLNKQPEFTLAIWDYLAPLVDSERISDGVTSLNQHQQTFSAIQKQYKVSPSIIAAIWGIESNYGQDMGRYPLVQSLATLSCFGRRQSFFTKELWITLKMLDANNTPVDTLYGSWAGAFGHTQFMPSTFARIAVDFDNDGRRDLANSIPDALASTANYLKRSGWNPAIPWGWEVALPPDLGDQKHWRKHKKPLHEWIKQGVRKADGSAFTQTNVKAGLLLPAGQQGPAWLVTNNFKAIYAYNAAESYALAIALLADRLAGKPAPLTPWPTDDPGLSRQERKELQTLLIMAGHDIGKVDGYLGKKTRAAVKTVQASLGWTADGRAGQKLLKALRQQN